MSARFNLRELRPGSLLPGCSALKRPVILYHAMPEEENRWIVGVSTIRRRGTVWGKARRSKVQVLPKIRRRCVHFYRRKDYLLSLSPILFPSRFLFSSELRFKARAWRRWQALGSRSNNRRFFGGFRFSIMQLLCGDDCFEMFEARRFPARCCVFGTFLRFYRPTDSSCR